MAAADAASSSGEEGDPWSSSPDELHATARRWDAAAAELGDAACAGGSAGGGLGDAAGEAAAAAGAAEATRCPGSTVRTRSGVVDGLLLTARSVIDADEAVAACPRPLGSVW